MADVLTLDLMTWDVTPRHATVAECVDSVLAEVLGCWDSGADLVLLPEFAWMMLEPLLPGCEDKLRAVAEVFWRQELPRLKRALARPDKAAVLGTCPYWESTSGQLRNRAPILRGMDLLYQDKLHLTPWERDLRPGGELRLFSFLGLTIAVIICLDIEVPELSALLRGRGVDLILCPSATETVLGVERVDRCASARAVELGCHVGVSHLLGKSSSDLIDTNIGRVAVYHPSQSHFARQPRWHEGAIETAGLHRLRVDLDPFRLRKMRRRRMETNPALLNIRSGANCLPVILR